MSLVQVCIDKSDLEDFKKEISTLLSNTKVLDLEITGFGPTKSGKFKQFNVGNTEDFTNLHKNVLNIAKKYKKLPVKKSYFYESDQISDSLLSYVTHFEEKYANENFDPHITLGIGEYNDKNVYPIKFQTDKIKIFHLGRNGTCKKEIV